MRKIPKMSNVSQISDQLDHWVAHTVQKLQTNGQHLMELLSNSTTL